MLHAISRILWALATLSLVLGISHIWDGIVAVGLWVLAASAGLWVLGAVLDAQHRSLDALEHIRTMVQSIEREVSHEDTDDDT